MNLNAALLKKLSASLKKENCNLELLLDVLQCIYIMLFVRAQRIKF